MMVRTLELEEFRNYHRFRAEFSPRINVIFGD